MVFFVTSRRRHTICALVTGVQTCALPILAGIGDRTHFGNANRRTWRAAASHIAVGAERRQPFGTLDSIKTTRLLYLRYGNGEIEVTLESGRSDARRVGNECVRTCRSRLAPSHTKKTKRHNKKKARQ